MNLPFSGPNIQRKIPELTYDNKLSYFYDVLQDDCGLIVGVEEAWGHGGMGAGGQGDMEIWPNPASGEMLNVECLMLNVSENYKLSIYDIFGRMAPARQISSPRMGGGREGGSDGRSAPTPTLPHSGEGVSWVVNVKELPPGIYLAVVREGTNIVARGKFVVAR